MKFYVKTEPHYDFVNITENIQRLVDISGLEDGLVSMFVVGSTAALTTMEFESGLKVDLKKFFEDIAPEAGVYEHHAHGGDKNAAAHIKASIIGASLTIPFDEKKLCIGTWQQIVLFDFNEHPRNREVVVKIVRTY